MLDILTAGQWKLLHAKLVGARAALELVADETFTAAERIAPGSGNYVARPYELVMDDLGEILAVA